MSVILPGQQPTAKGWQLAEYRTDRFSTEPYAGTGPLTLECPQLASDEMWLIDHAVVACNSVTPTEIRWYDGSPDPKWLLDGSSAGNFDVADWPAGLQIQPARSLLIVWEGASPGAFGAVTLQLRVLRR